MDLDQELDGLGHDHLVLAVQCYVPHDLELVQRGRVSQDLESRRLVSLLLLGVLRGQHWAIAAIHVQAVDTVAGLLYFG